MTTAPLRVYERPAEVNDHRQARGFELLKTFTP